ERVTRVRVSLTLAPSTDAPLARERVVSEWEDDRLMRAPGQVFTTGPSAEIRRAGASRVSKPVFQASLLPSVLGSPVAYVIVTNDSMSAQFQRIADWKTQNGVPA